MQSTSVGNDLVLVGERNLKSDIILMSWSSKRDLLCMANSNGDLLLYRLSSLEKVWSLPPPEKSCQITSLCWRPDGSVIAVSYDSKNVGIQFVYMEKAQIIYRLLEDSVVLKRPGILLRWFEMECDSADDPLHKFLSLSFKDYVAELPKLQSKDLPCIDIKRIIGNAKFHVLLVCDDRNTITCYAYGVFPLFCVPTGFYGSAGSAIKVLDMCMSNDLQYLVNINLSKSKETNCTVQLVKLEEVTNHLEKCKVLAEKVCYLQSIMVYLENVLNLMKESCENVVQEMESKLTNYLVKKSLSGTVGDEFMHFLLWGKPSEVVEDLLLNSMTPKGVIKLGSLVEASYISIQQLLTVNFQLASDALYYHLVEIKGMNTTTLLDNFQLFDVAKVTEVIELAGTFILKATEMQQVIGQSLKNFKAFFQWLYSCLLKFHEKPLDETPQMSMKEMEFVADFILESFIHEHEQLKLSGKEKHFNLDKVYQYLQSSPLTTTQNLDSNEWFHLVDSTPSLASNPLILKRKPSASLKQLFDELQNQLKTLFYCSCTVISSDYIVEAANLSHSQSQTPHLAQWYKADSSAEHCFYALASVKNFPCDEILLQKFSTSSRKSTRLRVKFSLPESSTQNYYSIQYFAYFNDEYFTVILTSDSTSFIAMVTLSSLLEELKQHGVTSNDVDVTTSYVCDASRFINVRRSTEPTVVTELATSGTRNILCVMSDNKRHIKAYELEAATDDNDSAMDSELDSSTLSI